MTEQEWLECRDPDLLLEQLVGGINHRQLTAYVQGCWDRVGQWLPDRSLGCAAVEHFAGPIGEQSMFDAARYADESAIQAARWSPDYAAERQRQAQLLREICGNPFQTSARTARREGEHGSGPH